MIAGGKRLPSGSKRFDGLVGAARDHADWDAIYGVSSTLSA
jgi:hypothetical protein